MSAVKRAGRKAKPKPVTLPGYNGQVELVPSVVDDPLEPGAKLNVVRNAHRNPLAHLFERGRLHSGSECLEDAEARLKAGEKFRAIYEQAEMFNGGGIDYSAPRVDTSFAYKGIPEQQADAHKRLAAASIALGSHYTMIRAVVGEERPFLPWLDAHFGYEASRQQRLQAYAELRAALDSLIEHFGIAKGRPKRHPVYVREVKPLSRRIEITVKDGRIELADA